MLKSFGGYLKTSRETVFLPIWRSIGFNKIHFLGYVVSAKGVQIEAERIKVVKSWPEPKSIQDIQVFIRFANFYWRFIQRFSKIAAPLTLMLKTSSNTSTPSQKLTMGYDKTSNKKLSKSKNPAFLTANARQAFIRLRQAFTKAPILSHFNSEHHIRIQINASGYAIDGILSQLTSDSSQRNLVAYFSWKMILAETRYNTHNSELLAIIGAFKTWWHYLKGCKHEVFVLIDYNNLCQFIDTKSLALVRFGRLRNSLDTIFKSIITKARPMELQTLYFAFHREVLRRKKSFKLRILKFLIVCSFHWQVQVL